MGVIILEEHSVSLSQLRERKYCFEVGFRGPNSRTYTLSADTEESMTSWMRSLTHASFQYLRMMVQELQRQVTELTEQKKETVPLGLDRMDQPLAASASGSSKQFAARAPPPRPSLPAGQPLVQPVRTVGVPHERRLGTCGASSALALGQARSYDDSDGEVAGAVATPPTERRTAAHMAYSSPGLARHQMDAGSDPTPVLQPQQALASGGSSGSSISGDLKACSNVDLGESDEDDSCHDSSAKDASKVESAEEHLQRLSIHSMHYGSSFHRDSPLT